MIIYLCDFLYDTYASKVVMQNDMLEIMSIASKE